MANYVVTGQATYPDGETIELPNLVLSAENADQVNEAIRDRAELGKILFGAETSFGVAETDAVAEGTVEEFSESTLTLALEASLRAMA